MTVLEDQLRDSECGPSGQQADQRADQGDQRRLEGDQQQQESERQNHDHDDGKVVVECLLKVEIFGRSAADERRFRQLRPKVGKDGFHRRI